MPKPILQKLTDLLDRIDGACEDASVESLGDVRREVEEIRGLLESGARRRPSDEPDGWAMSCGSILSLAYSKEDRVGLEGIGYAATHPFWLSPLDIADFCNSPIDADGYQTLRRLRDFLHARDGAAGVSMEWEATLHVRDELVALLGGPEPEGVERV